MNPDPRRPLRAHPVSARHRPGAPEPYPTELWWQIRFFAAMEAAYDITLRINQRHLRLRVIDHIAAHWWHAYTVGGQQRRGLKGFFLDYCRDVECDIDPQVYNRDWELHRVWTNHAAVLGGDLDRVHPRRPAE
jgi:hypothetical protein